MQKDFNVTGLCIPEKHYMADISEMIQEITHSYVDKGLYFTINRPRQYGKTTALYMLEKELSGNYFVISLSFEAADDLFASRYTLTAGLIRRIGRKLQQENLEKELLENWNMPVSENFPLEDFSDRITDLCRLSPKKIVLIIDEVDRSSDNQIFLSLLGLLRSKYMDRQKGQDYTFHSVILASVYDIKNLKLKLHPSQESNYNSPWNIAADFTVSMELSQNGIAQMLADYENDHHTGMDISMISRELYEYTSGYPYLISRICRIMDEQFRQQKEYSWSMDGFQSAVRTLMKERNTLFDDLRKKLEDYPTLKRILYEILFLGKDIPYNPDQQAMDIASMLGYLKESSGYAVVTNRIFEMRLYNYFLSEEILDSKAYESALQIKNQFIRNGQLNMRIVLQKFVDYFSEIYGSSTDTFVEENGRKLFLLYLKPIINGTGNYYIEARTRTMGRTDVIIDYLGKQYILEMKIWRGEEYLHRGEQQLERYLEDYHLKEGYLLSFCFNKKKTVGVREILLGKRTLVEAIV